MVFGEKRFVTSLTCYSLASSRQITTTLKSMCIVATIVYSFTDQKRHIISNSNIITHTIGKMIARRSISSSRLSSEPAPAPVVLVGAVPKSHRYIYTTHNMW